MKIDNKVVIQIAIIVVLLLAIGYNLGGGKVGISGNSIATGIGTVSASDIIPKGVPAIYGKELGISYDDISPSNQRLADSTIDKLTEYEDIELSEAEMKRYIAIAGSISCEYCCGANAIIFSNGERACGCAHSYAMRGLAKYLLTEHGNELTDEEILTELGKWKVLFFPGIHEDKAKVLEANGIDSNDYINLASNLYRGIEKGQTSGGGMVGGC
jgi:hypothetical protein